MMRFGAKAREKLGHSLWLVPGLCVLAAIGLSFGAVAIDETLQSSRSAWFLFGGGPEGARSILAAVATSMMTFTGVVFSVTILVLQLASTQFSPRALRTFLRDRGSQLSLGVFVGTFIYALLTLRSVRGDDLEVPSFVPSLSVWIAVALVIVSVGTFVYYLDHIAQLIRVVNVLARIGRDTRASVDRMYPAGIGAESEDDGPRRPPGPPRAVVVHEGPSGVVFQVDEEALWDRVRKADGVVLALRPTMGDFVADGSVLFEVWGDPGRLDEDALRDTVALGNERTLRHDPGFGIRELVDIAARALSPSLNDPTSAVQALDQLHDVLRRLARRRFPAPFRLDEDGRLKLVLSRPTFDDYVRLALDEIRQYGEGHVQIARRLAFLVEDLLELAPPSRRAELLRQQRLLRGAVVRGFDSFEDRLAAHAPSPQGHGPS